MAERQIRYNRFTSDVEQDASRHRWVFLVINEPREISRIRERIFEQLQMISDQRKIAEGLIPRSGGLHYSCFAFSSPIPDIKDRSRIYASKNFKPDRVLIEGDDVWVNNYVERLCRKA